MIFYLSLKDIWVQMLLNKSNHPQSQSPPPKKKKKKKIKSKRKKKGKIYGLCPYQFFKLTGVTSFYIRPNSPQAESFTKLGRSAMSKFEKLKALVSSRAKTNSLRVYYICFVRISRPSFLSIQLLLPCNVPATEGVKWIKSSLSKDWTGELLPSAQLSGQELCWKMSSG